MVPKPKANAKAISHGTLPFFAKSCAGCSPIRKQPHFQPHDKQRQSCDDQHKAAHHLADILQRLLKHGQLKHTDRDDDRQQIPRAVPERFSKSRVIRVRISETVMSHFPVSSIETISYAS